MFQRLPVLYETSEHKHKTLLPCPLGEAFPMRHALKREKDC